MEAQIQIKERFQRFLVWSLIIMIGGGFFLSPDFSSAQESSLGSGRVTVFLTPRAETVIEGTTFDVSIYLDTQGQSINAVDLELKFPSHLLSIVKPSGGRSFISLWVAHPSFSNTNGTASFIGVVPNGIVTRTGLITTITFQAKAPGEAVVEVLPASQVLANDGAGTALSVDRGRGNYTIEPQPPEGVKVFSETHPFPNRWYNNNSPVLNWEKDAGVTDFSFEFNNQPSTTPDNNPETDQTITAYENQADGLWFFHIKARKNNVWGSTTHFPIRIDTLPPASFEPKLEIIKGGEQGDKGVVSFFTTDSLSGLDHYEIGLVDKRQSSLESPAFVLAESPYQLPSFTPGDLRITVRATDRAGNVRDETIESTVPGAVLSFFQKYKLWIAVGIILLLLLLLLLHYFYRHHVIAIFKRVVNVWKKEGEKERAHHSHES
ncbi:hypothetical protein HY628_02480 [Candidatus Uhrbacteria bacterium]|nr:hypothetical protein [Candidatus Uhrbacteria bacterium]